MDLKKISKIFIIISMILGCFLIVPIIIGAIALNKLKEEKFEKNYAIISILTIFLCSVAGGLLMLINYIEKNNNDIKLIKDNAKVLIIISMVIGSSSILPIIIGAIALSKIDSQISRKEYIILGVLTTVSCSAPGGLLMILALFSDSNTLITEEIRNEENNISLKFDSQVKKEIKEPAPNQIKTTDTNNNNIYASTIDNEILEEDKSLEEENVDLSNEEDILKKLVK